VRLCGEAAGDVGSYPAARAALFDVDTFPFESFADRHGVMAEGPIKRLLRPPARK